MKSLALLLCWITLASAALKEPAPKITKIIGGLSGSGHTTHYWDCCVPACSFPTDMSVVTHGVVYCLTDGVTKVTDYTGTSECQSPGSGTAYTCNDNQPWIVNSTLAYGFTAASFQGYHLTTDDITQSKWFKAFGKVSSDQWNNYYICHTESAFKTGNVIDAADAQPLIINFVLAGDECDVGGVETGDCCKCVLLSFQGALAGKQYLAQITNTGSDLTQNHFDIQIPGGGVGIFNGCERQWDAGADGWGERYGGVTTEEECNELPSVLQDGCKFRWTFLNGVENPDVTFEQVDCPTELTEKTGCKNVNDN